MGKVLLAADGPLGEALRVRLGEGCELVAPTAAVARVALERLRPTAVVAVAPVRRGEADVAAGTALVRACAEAQVARLVLVTSAAIHEPNHHHPGHVAEDRLTAHRTGNPIAQSWATLEVAAQTVVAGSQTTLVVLRPAPVVVPRGRDFWSRLLRRRLVFTVLGFDPSVQLLSADDLVGAVRAVLAAPAATGAYHVAPAGVVPLFRGLRLAGVLPVPLPFWLHRLVRALLAPLGLAAPAAQIDYLRHPFTVSGAKIERELGFRPVHASLPRAPPFDDFGMSPSYVRRLNRTLFRFLHDVWWRVEERGLEHVPTEGPAVLVGVHRGHQPWDGVMMLHLLTRRLGRFPRFLIHPTLVKFPFLAPYIIRCGGLHASQENADWVLGRGELLGIFPEGIRGAFTRYKDAYRLRKFGRDEYVGMALRHRVPIVPFVTIGHAEIFPILAKIRWGWWERFSEWPCLPITPTMSLIPLPSKWHTWFLEPVDLAGYPPEAAEDRAIIQAISQSLQERLQTAIDAMLARRKSIFFGSIFEGEPA